MPDLANPTSFFYNAELCGKQAFYQAFYIVARPAKTTPFYIPNKPA